MTKKRKTNWYFDYWTKRLSWNNEHVIDFRWSNVQKEDEEVIIRLTLLKL